MAGPTRTAEANDLVIRDATVADADACAAIYEPYVQGTAITFEESPPSVEEMAARIVAKQIQHVWLVAELGGRVVGYAYGGPFHGRAAYRWTTEVSVYIDADAHRGGIGRALYQALLPKLAERGFLVAIAVICLPNEASVALHERLGFEHCGTIERVGWKLGRWRDVAWYQSRLGDAAGRVGPPVELI